MSISQRQEASACKVNGVGAAVLVVNDGFNTPVRTGAGAYTIKTDRQWDLNGTIILGQIFGGAANANIQITSADGLNWTIATSVAAVATDEIFALYLEPVFT